MNNFRLTKQQFEPNEKQTENSIRRYLNMRKIFNWPTHAGQIIPVVNGISDIIGALPGSGRILAIEVKRPGWKPPEEGTKQYKHYREQLEFQDNIKKSNGIAFFASSVEEVALKLQVR